tara:strand:- start:249 stop:677 length:429 start_codon:yes stop_codon:yes gene_type:complete
MRITKRQLRRIIKEEKAKLIAETRVRKLARNSLYENTVSETTAGAYITDGIYTEVEPIDANLEATGPSIQWPSSDLTSPDTLASLRKAVSLYGSLEILDDPEGLSDPGTTVEEWLEVYLQEMIENEGFNEAQSAEIYNAVFY